MIAVVLAAGLLWVCCTATPRTRLLLMLWRKGAFGKAHRGQTLAHHLLGSPSAYGVRDAKLRIVQDTRLTVSLSV